MLLTCTPRLFGQAIELGLYGGGGLSRLRNSRVSDFFDGTEPVSAAPAYGFGAAYTTPRGFGVNVEAAHCRVVQCYGHYFPGQGHMRLAAEIFTYCEGLLLARYRFPSRFFIEAGPKLSVLTTARTEQKMWPADQRKIALATASFREKVVSAVLGAGVSYPLTKRIAVSGCLRAAYAFSDATRRFGNADFLMLQAQNEASFVTRFAHNKVSTTLPVEYSRTTLVTLHVFVGISYNISLRRRDTLGS